jgi:hypothetical protein
MIHFLVTAQYEAAIVRDQRKIIPVLRAFPHSIVYFNIDARVAKTEIDQIIRAVIAGHHSHGAEVGILSYDRNPQAARKYLMEYGATCGYLVLELGFERSARIVMKALNAAGARGERRYVRVKVPSGKGTFNVAMDGRTISGEVLDVSEAGMACVMRADFQAGTYLQDIQLRLWGAIVSVNGTIRGTRAGRAGTIYVVMFDELRDSRVRSKMYGFLKRVMQYEVDKLL